MYTFFSDMLFYFAEIQRDVI